ncbi:hypothetical protein F5J12DRAFT_720365 [Pisolithus orientalis]|uniref:uncharacterized protein n=1 Tax=Pisolithus orientalis TaxID=936130 RepID=UPI00222574BB|nr:uncharacterized protein F5J12DRAFT_720365 [Pisolithus orientalis]KAI6007680.1 hypothetical protein F5J12DRAFT_720365 [Pisolithus orientalis]
MHPCLCVDEILRVVFRCIEDRSTWCALARTCRAFTEPATDLIWETLTAVEPILQHLPSARTERLGFGDRGRCLALSRPLSDDDWSIIRRLSSRVHRLHTLFNAMNNAVP